MINTYNIRRIHGFELILQSFTHTYDKITSADEGLVAPHYLLGVSQESVPYSERVVIQKKIGRHVSSGSRNDRERRDARRRVRTRTKRDGRERNLTSGGTHKQNERERERKKKKEERINVSPPSSLLDEVTNGV